MEHGRTVQAVCQCVRANSACAEKRPGELSAMHTRRRTSVSQEDRNREGHTMGVIAESDRREMSTNRWA